MHLFHLRFQTEDDHTKSIFCIDGEFQCFFLEDGFNVIKVYGETRFTPGTRKVTLRTEGGKHEKYLERYGPDFHKGMLWIRDINNYKYVYIHSGVSPEDTLGCPLTGFATDTNKNKVSQSRAAYEKIYPIISEAILKGEEVEIETVDLQQIL